MTMRAGLRLALVAAWLPRTRTGSNVATGPSQFIGRPLEFECGRFDLGDRCNEEKLPGGKRVDLCESKLPCCKRFEVPFINKNFDPGVSQPTILVSVLRPPKLSHAIFSAVVRTPPRPNVKWPSGLCGPCAEVTSASLVGLHSPPTVK